jgi:hypothetical protein
MTKTAPIPTSSNAGVWIDHRKAQIVGLAAEGETARLILSNVEKHPERGGDSPMQGAYEARQVPADDRRQRALTGELNIYYDAVIEALRDYDRVLVFGPGEAKGELHARLLKKQQGGRVADVETTDQMTDRQVAAKVRAYFGAAAARS